VKQFLAAIVLLLTLQACGSSGPSFLNTDVTGADYGKELSLTDHTGKPRTLAEFRGKIVVVFFGYTRCPDVCPTTLSEMKMILDKLGEDRKKIQVLFVTIDPERDTPELLAKYVPAFDPSFLGLYGDEAATIKAAKEFKVFFQKVPGKTPDSYTMDHTAASYIIDTQGRLRLFARYGQPDSIATDLQTLLSTSN